MSDKSMRLCIEIPDRFECMSNLYKSNKFYNINTIVFGRMPTKEEFSELRKKYDIKAVLSLIDDPPIFVNDSSIPIDFPITYKSVPISHGKPNEKKLKEILEFINFYYTRSEYIFIHCKFGVKRSPFIIILFLINQGYEKNIAVNTLMKISSTIDLTIEEYNFINDFDNQ